MESLVTPEKLGAGPRFAARFVDGLVLLIPVMLVSVPISGGFQVGTGNDGKQVLATGLGVLISYAYFVWMESNRGATVGKRAFRIEVTAATGQPTLAQSARRNAWMLLGIVPGSFGGLLVFGAAIAIAVSISRDPEGRGFHDRFADVTCRLTK